MILKISYNRLN